MFKLLQTRIGHPTDRITHTTAFVTPFVEHWLEREIAQWVDPTTHRTISERSYHGATSRSFVNIETYTSNIIYRRFRELISISVAKPESRVGLES